MKIAKHIRKLAGYVPGEQPKSKSVIKLNTNENPYPPSPECAKVLKSFDLDRLRRYCDPNCCELRSALAELNATTPDRIFVGNGSDEVLSLAARCFVEDDEAIGSLDPSYSLYRTLAEIRNVKWRGTPLATNQSTSVHLHLSPSPSTPVSLFLLTNPNAPTGTVTPKAEIEKFAKSFKGVLLIDEAYGDFAEWNCMDLATEDSNRNVIVMRTFSKSYSLAGLRVGYCVGPEDLIEAMYKAKDSYNVDAVAQAVATAAAKDQKWMRANVAKVVAERARLTRELERRGWDVLPSQSNFLFAKPAHLPAAELFDRLRKRNIFVRYFTSPKTADRLRVTIGTRTQMNRLLKAIDELDIEK